MQAVSIGLPWIKNKNTDIMDTGTAQSYSNTQDKIDKLKWKKITDYTKDVQSSYKTLRNINNMTINEHATDSQYTCLGTRPSGYTNFTYSIALPGVISWYFTSNIFGLRPVITK